MADVKVKLTGRKAVVVIAVVLIVAGLRLSAGRATLPNDGADALRVWLHAEYVREGLPALEQAIQANDDAAAEAQTREILARDRIVFGSLKARGSTSEVVVRVEIQVDGGAPPVGPNVRYFLMEHSMITGWRMVYETSAMSYYLKFF